MHAQPLVILLQSKEAGSNNFVDVAGWPLQTELIQVFMRFCPRGEAHAHPVKQVNVANAQDIYKAIKANQSRCVHKTGTDKK